MTLSTDIYINAPIDAHKVHAKVNEILGIVNPKISDDPQFERWERDADGKATVKVFGGPESLWCVENEPMQGFPAWVMVHYRKEGPAVGPELNHDEDCQLPADKAGWKYPEDGPCTYRRHFPHCVHIDLDTAYSYQDEQGRGCSELHVDVIVKLGFWLDEQGITDWEWTNEYSGVTYKRFDGLETMIENGAKAMQWFTSTARPAIAAHAAAAALQAAPVEERAGLAAKITDALVEGDAEQFEDLTGLHFS